MSVRIGVLTDDKLDYQMVQSLMRLAHTRGLTDVIWANGDVGRLDEGRNRVVAHFLQGDAEWLLWIDTDMVFEPTDFDLIYNRAKQGHPIVSGLYYRASDPPTPCMMRRDKAGFARAMKDWPKGKAITVDSVGFGFVLTHREVLEKMRAQQFNPASPWFDNAERGPAGQTLADDSSFCWRAQQLGYQILVDTSVVLGHVKCRVLYGP